MRRRAVSAAIRAEILPGVASIRGAVNRRSAVGRAGEMRLGSATGENGRSLAARNDGKLHRVVAERLAKIGKIRGVGIDHAEGRSGAAAEDAAAGEYGEQIIGRGGGVGDGYEESGIRGGRTGSDGQGNSTVGTGVLTDIDAGDAFPGLAQIRRDVHAVAGPRSAGRWVARGIAQRGVDRLARGIAGVEENVRGGIERRAHRRSATGLNTGPMRSGIG